MIILAGFFFTKCERKKHSLKFENTKYKKDFSNNMQETRIWTIFSKMCFYAYKRFYKQDNKKKEIECQCWSNLSQ